MPLETAQYLSDLNPNNPVVTDPTSQGDDHIRLVKNVLKTTFPNITGPVTGTQAELNAAVAASDTGASKLADAGAFFNTNSTDGVTNPVAGEVDVQAGGNAVVKFKSDKSATFQGPIVGPGAIPVGGTLLWWSDTLPDASWGTFAWCNGDTYLRSNTALWNILGTSQGAGDGTTTANLPDLREAVPVGKSTMGATAARGVITNFTSAILTKIGQLFGEGDHKITPSESAILTYTSAVDEHGGHSHNVSYNSQNGAAGSGSSPIIGYNGSFPSVPTSTQLTGITVATTANAGDQAHNNVQPSVVCNFIIRTA